MINSKIKYFGFFALVAFDQASKAFALKYLSTLTQINVRGAFSVSLGNIDFTIISSGAIILFIALTWFFDKRYLTHPGSILILSGGVSNLVDRFVYGGVVDFFKTNFWANFNLADTFITVGAILLALEILFSGKTKQLLF